MARGTILHPQTGAPARQRRIVATYDYHDQHGQLLFQVVRYDPKDFRQRRPDGSGGWIWKLDGVDRVLYRLPELLQAAPYATVFICEGEKDCNALHDRGLIATTNPGGAGKWLPSMSEHLRDRNVVILPDNDDAGEKHADDVARALQGIAKSVRVLRLPGLPDKGDLSDWLAAGGTAEELERLAAGVDEPPPSEEAEEPQSAGTAEAESETQHPANDGSTAGDKTRKRRRGSNILALVTHINTTAAWNGALRFNLLTEGYEICPPFPPQDGAKEPSRPLRDPQDILTATMYFQANGFPKAGKNTAWDAVVAVAHQRTYHPVRDYLTGLRWDGTERVSSCSCPTSMPSCRTDRQEERDRHVAYLEHISTGFMVGAVARVMQPGCKNDQVPVVVGPERSLKSSAIRRRSAVTTAGSPTTSRST